MSDIEELEFRSNLDVVRVLSRALADLPAGIPDARKAMQTLLNNALDELNKAYSKKKSK